MPKVKSSPHAEILAYALSHLEQERDAIQAKINHIKQELKGIRNNSVPIVPAKLPAKLLDNSGDGRFRRYSSFLKKYRFAGEPPGKRNVVRDQEFRLGQAVE